MEYNHPLTELSADELRDFYRREVIRYELREAALHHALQQTTDALEEALNAAPVIGVWHALYHTSAIKRKPRAKLGGLNRTKELEEKDNLRIIMYASLVKAKEEARKVLAKGKSYDKENPVKRYRDESGSFITPHDSLSIKFGNTFKHREPCE